MQTLRHSLSSVGRSRPAFRPLLALLALCAGAITFAAETPATGTIRGRVVNATNGLYVSKAVVTVAGSNQQALTDNFGNYVLEGVPAGTSRVQVTFTGQAPVEATVAVTAGGVATRDFMFNRDAAETTGEATVVKLNAFVVNSERFRTASDIAINEQRYSPTLKNVVAAGAFGDIPDGNVGEFVKYIPGVQIGYGYPNSAMNAADSNATSISVRGFGPEMTSITIDGVPLTNASPATLTRAIGLDMMSINNASRVEVIKVPTPDMPSNSPGGAINLVTRSAFEHARPQLNVHVGMNLNSELVGDLLQKTPGPANKATYKTLPSVDFSYVIPLSKTMGFTFSGAWMKSFNVNHRALSDYLYDTRGISTNSNFAIDLRPVGGPNVRVAGGGTTTTYRSIDGDELNIANPVLYRFQAVDTPNTATRTSGSLRFDWRPRPGQRLTVGYTLGLFSTVDAQRRLQFNPNSSYLMDWGPDFMTSYRYYARGTVVNGTPLAADFNPRAAVSMTVTTRDRESATHSGYVQYELRKNAWLVRAMVNGSRSRGSYKDMDNGHFSELETSIAAGQVLFTGIREGIPGRVQINDRSGLPLDFSRLANWAAPTVQAKSGETEAMDQTFNARLDIDRELDFINLWDLTATAKAGFYRVQQRQKKWGVGTGFRMTYYGPALALTDYLDDGYSGVSPGFGLPGQEWVSTYKLFKLWRDHPDYFNSDSDADRASNYASWANQQRSITETSDQYYVSLEGRLLKNRLMWLVGSRQEIATRKGYATRSVSTWNYVKNADGSLYRDTANPNGVRIDQAGSPLFANTAAGTALRSNLTAAGITYPTAVVANNSYAMRQLALLPFSNMDGKVTGKPTFTASGGYNITEDFMARLSWHRAQGRPDFEDGVITQSLGFSINEAADPTAVPRGTIRVPNPNLEPWVTNSFNLQLAYYTKSGGHFAVTPYVTLTKNFQESVTMRNEDPEFASTLSELGLDAEEYRDYELTTMINGDGTSKTIGWELEASQDLKFLGGFGRHFYVFGNFSHHYVKQQNTNRLSARPLSGTTASGGISFNNKRVRILVRGLWLERQYAGEELRYTYDGSERVLAKYFPAQLNLDVNLGYQISERYSVFANARNVLNTSRDTLRFDVDGIVPEWGRHIDRRKFGVNWNVGVNATF